MSKLYKIAEIAKLTDLSIPTLRYYEALELLHPDRDSNNYRIFTDDDLRWIAFIKRAKATGMTLSKIVDYSKLREKGDSTVLERINILAEQEMILQVELEKIQAHINFLQNKKQFYTQFLENHKTR